MSRPLPVSGRRLITALTLSALAACSGGSGTAQGEDGAGAPDATADASGGGGLTAGANAVGPARPLPPGVLMLQRASIPDPGVIASTTAMTALVPAGWRAQGGVIRGASACDEPYAVDWTATSADGQSTLSIFPTEVWSASNTGATGNCPLGEFMSVQDYLTARMERTYPGARVVEFTNRPDFAESAVQMVQRNLQRLQTLGSGFQGKAEGGELHFTFTQNGVEMHGMLAATAAFYLSQLPNAMGGPPLSSLSAGTLGTFGATAPVASWDKDLVEASRRSIVPNAEWLQQLFSVKNQLGEIAVQGTRERAAIIVAGGAAATKANIESFQRMSGADGSRASEGMYPGDASSDRSQRRSIEAIRGVDTYHDPVSGSAVQLDHTYGNAWRVNNQDAYILTKDPNFNPGQYGITATQMKQIR
ncbi:MAG: hypothetical protein LCH84_07960 [Gemmatimonadetes bacterium]|nr:hypothetical protein [Gemmatimonadota bacterium]